VKPLTHTSQLPGGDLDTRRADYRGPEVRPTYVYGTQHSGTTILYNLLALHPDFAWFSQYSHHDGAVPGRRRMPMAHAVDRLLRSVRTHDWQKPPPALGKRERVSTLGLRRARQGLSVRLVPRPQEAVDIFGYIVAAPTRAEAASRMRRLVDQECRRWRRTAFLAKPLPMFGHLDVLQVAHPHARMIHIVRDGRPVAASIREKFMRSGQSPREGLDLAAARWLEVLDEVERLQLPVLTLRYEDFCADVHGYLRRSLQHAGLDAEAFPFAGIPTALTPTNERRLREFGSGELEAVQDAQAPALRRLGYLD
jgi:omega-hydroxy-beta-dihydromenaquinone-9 sulfotransferase